ncbi:MAG: hypothetical protein WKG01_17710 [Kofleriaceae bacterium]
MWRLAGVVAIVLVVVGCKDRSTEPDPGADPGAASSATPSTSGGVASSAAPATAGGTRVAFDLNGVAASTEPRPGVDRDQATGQISNVSNTLRLFFYGAAPTAPRRGFLSITVNDFARAPGELADPRAIFTAFEGPKQEPNYTGTLAVAITRLEPGPANTVGKTWLASGTFSGELSLQRGAQSTVPTVKFTAGTFDKLVVQETGKPR